MLQQEWLICLTKDYRQNHKKNQLHCTGISFIGSSGLEMISHKVAAMNHSQGTGRIFRVCQFLSAVYLVIYFSQAPISWTLPSLEPSWVFVSSCVFFLTIEVHNFESLWSYLACCRTLTCQWFHLVSCFFLCFSFCSLAFSVCLFILTVEPFRLNLSHNYGINWDLNSQFFE